MQFVIYAAYMLSELDSRQESRTAQTHENVAEISTRLKNFNPDARSELDFTSPFEWMIGSILAAQNTDRMICFSLMFNAS